MTAAARAARNVKILGECWPPFAARVGRVWGRMGSLGYRPRGQVGYRSLAQQAVEVAEGSSRVPFGYHNCTSPGGAPESLAVDIVDDLRAMDPSMGFIRALAVEAALEGLETGILFGCSRAQKAAIGAWLAGGPEPPRIDIGWDPLHVQPAGFSIPRAKRGERPPWA